MFGMHMSDIVCLPNIVVSKHAICLQASIKMAQKMADLQQQEYIAEEQKARVQEAAVRQVHQRKADQAMDVSHNK